MYIGVIICAMLIDTHCHLDFERFDEDRDAIVARAAEAGITRIIVPALQLENCTAVLRLTEQYEGVYAAVGIHPNSSAAWEDGWINQIRAFAQHEKVVAIGEIGLDYHWDESPKTVQHRALRMQLDLAAELDLPVILHNRESSADIVELLQQSPARKGVMHSFSASWQTAVSVLEMGFYLGFTGPVTFKKADELRAIVARVPADRLLLETDAPFLTPHPYRGKRNEPAYVAYIADRVAAVRGVTVAELATQTTANAERLFGIG